MNQINQKLRPFWWSTSKPIERYRLNRAQLLHWLLTCETWNAIIDLCSSLQYARIHKASIGCLDLFNTNMMVIKSMLLSFYCWYRVFVYEDETENRMKAITQSTIVLIFDKAHKHTHTHTSSELDILAFLSLHYDRTFKSSSLLNQSE
jgi:hypothetical protein